MNHPLPRRNTPAVRATTAPSVRIRLPWRRESTTLSVYLGGHKMHLTVGFYPDGRVGEVWVNVHKVGASMRGLLDCFARLISKELQRGVTVEKLIEKYDNEHFEPNGEVRDHETITEAPSIVALVVRVIEGETGKGEK